MCGGSPLFRDYFIFVFLFFHFRCRGEYTGWRRIYTLVLPSVEFLLLFEVFCFVKCRGDSQVGGWFILSFSPLWTGILFFFFLFLFFYSCRGDSQGSNFKSTLVLPPVFLRYPKMGIPPWAPWWYDTVMRGRDGGDHPTLLCIYIV